MSRISAYDAENVRVSSLLQILNFVLGLNAASNSIFCDPCYSSTHNTQDNSY